MTSYVYNPSKKVTELLSKYLEFDPEQLKLGIWSGNLVLRDVNLREEALSPLLHPYTFGNVSAQGRPPLRLKLVSGKIGSLSVQIPWKRLMWGQGDVRVDLRNVVLSVALERCEDDTPAKDNEAEQRANHAENFSRDKKQRILRDAEKRCVQKRSIGPWLNAIKKQDAEEKAKKLKLKGSARSEDSDGRLTKWLRGVSSDIFWRFWVGLQMNIENFKIVLVQDGIEIGLVLPMSRVIAVKSVDAVKELPVPRIPRPPLRDESDVGSYGSHLSIAGSREGMDGFEIEENENVDKEVNFVGIGFYVRRLPNHESKQVPGSMSDIYTSDYILRPFDVEFKFSMFFPLPTDKRKRKAPSVKPQGNTDPVDGATHMASDGSAKRRRGKRDKQTVSEETKVTEAETNDEDLLSPLASRSMLSAHLGSSTPSQAFKKSILQRRNSLSGTSHRRSGKLVRHASADGTTILPLARPEDIGAAYASRAKTHGRTAKFDGKLKIGAVSIVCSEYHYNLLSCFLVSAVQIANGRPTTSIQSAHDAMHDSEAFDESFSDLMDQTRLTHSRTIRSWWKYAGGALLFELRQRNRLQRVFEEKYLSFSWSRLTYRRPEYVELFIAANLDKSNTKRIELRRRLHNLEDELCIEQILLYRAIARSIHVRGGRSMPESILDLHKGRQTTNNSHGNPIDDSKLDSSDDGDNLDSPGNDHSVLADLSVWCETARARRSTPLESRPPPFESFRRDFEGDQADDLSFGYASDVKSLRTSRSIKSTGRSVATTAMEGVATNDFVTGMLFAFGISVENIEIMLVEGGDHVNGYSVSCDSDSSINDDETFPSDVLSVLTDDKRFEHDGSIQGMLPEESESSTNRIYSSSDFLLFKAPEKVILRLVVSSLSCESLGRSGDSKNVNLSIGGILLGGDNDVAVIDCGDTNKRDSPLHEIEIQRTMLGATRNIDSLGGTSLTVSLVEKSGHAFLQFDAPKLRICPDSATVQKLNLFFGRSSSRIPGPLLQPSPRDSLRMYILQQNSRSPVSLNCSIRIHGLEISMPVPLQAESMTDEPRHTVCLSFDIIELYSGTAVDDLKDCLEEESASGEGSSSLSSPFQKRSLVTRHLSMINVPMMMQAKESPHAIHMVCASSGTQLLMFSDRKKEPITFLKDAVAVELFCSFNTNMLEDYNRSNCEVTAEVSPIYFLASDARMEALRSVIKESSSMVAGLQNPTASKPPRLEILSGMMLQSIDVSLNGMQITLLTSEELAKRPIGDKRRIAMAESLSIFLNNVSKFDLNYPHDEALSSAMQVCIDQLSGLGLNLEEAWELTNMVMLGFLEDLVARDATFETKSDDIERSIIVSVERAVELYSDELDETEAEVTGAYMLDIPDGVTVSTCHLFYDTSLHMSIPSLYLSNGSGVHLLRITPANNSDDETTVSSNEHSTSLASESTGLSLHFFQVDYNYPFGSGGMALSTLGSGRDGNDLYSNDTETIVDFAVEDCESFCHPKIINGLLQQIIPQRSSEFSAKSSKGSNKQKWSQLCTVEKFSFSLFSDSFIPVSRVVAADLTARTSTAANGFVLATKSLEVIDLTPAGELFPSVVSTIGGELALKATMNLGDDKQISLEFSHLHIILLRRFLNEILQYITSVCHDFGETARQDKSLASSTKVAFSLLISESTLSLPRSSTNYDLIAFQFSSLSAEVFMTASSFQLPTLENQTLQRNSCRVESNGISRTEVQLSNVKIFSALLDTESGATVVDNPSFRFFYRLSQPPFERQYVFQRIRSDEKMESHENGVDSQRANMVWRQISKDSINLDVLVDFDPHLRILMCDPTDQAATGFSLCLEERQFALLLSVWYSNMQELPLVFPFSAEQIYHGSGNENRRNASNIPSLGSDNLLDYITKLSPKVTSEIAISLTKLEWTILSLAEPDPTNSDMEANISMSFSAASIHIVNNEICITSISSGCAYASLCDHSLKFSDVLSVGGDQSGLKSWPDPSFGSDQNFKQLRDGLPQAFQLCVHMSPIWSMYNLGLDSPMLNMADFDTVYRLLDWFSGYFTDESKGNPNFGASLIVESIRHDLIGASSMRPACAVAGNGTDFRLWVARPQLHIPLDVTESSSSVVQIKANGGLWYKYVSDGKATVHEFVTDSMELSLGKKQHPEDADSIVRNLSLGVRYAWFEENFHSDLNVQVPFNDFKICSTSNLITISPEEVSPPMICKAPQSPNRKFVGVICDVTVVANSFPRVYTAIMGLLGIKKESGSAPSAQKDLTSSYVFSINDIRIFFLDPQLGEHLPLAAVSVPSINVTASNFKVGETKGSVFFDTKGNSFVDPDPTDTQVILKTKMWADYFKLGSTRNWEPLLETTAFECTFERSRRRGSGITVACASETHLNLSSAFLMALDDFILCYYGFSGEAGGTTDTEPRSSDDYTHARVAESACSEDILHEIPKVLSDSQRVAFSLKNLTGVTLRIYRPACASEGMSALSYLHHKQVTDLQFLPSVSIVRNLRIADVPYPGTSKMGMSKHESRLSQNFLSIQLPGFKWHHEIKVDTFGRSFSKLVPIEETTRNKIENNWRLTNALALVVEVGLQPGGRQVTIQSAFSLVNRTDYPLFIEPSAFENLQSPDEGIIVEPGESFHIPPLLLNGSLQSSFASLGYVFIRPRLSRKAIEEIFPSEIEGGREREKQVGRCSRPIDLNRIVDESSDIFSAALGQDIKPDNAVTCSQLSCPVVEKHSRGSSSPFCMTLETRRSPLVRDKHSHSLSAVQHIHGPIDYTLSIFPPIVIKNLLPKRGRFELMHAVRHQVIWYAELGPGQHASVHSIGLDAPLLLYVNLSFARTPVGEGVLVHVGSDQGEMGKNNPIALKNIGKAGKAMTKQLGKTLTSIGESPDLRSQHRTERESISLLSAGERNTKSERTDKQSNGDDKGRNHAAVRTFVLPSSDVAEEISVVDGLGQRLVLGIENVRGGGGQRHISVFSRYWIVNTTEHSLRYKQEKGSAFVSGNIFSPLRDGSREIDNVRPSGKIFEGSINSNTGDSSGIFSGTPGALSMALGDRTPEATASLLDRDMPLARLAKLSFMFNFQDSNVMTIGQHRLCVRLSDGTGASEFESDWSRGFGLESIGISQVVAMHCKDGRMLEVTMIVQKPIFDGKTKVIRFLPRYVVVNKLPYPLHIFQDSSVFQGSTMSSHLDTEIRLIKWRSTTPTSMGTRSLDDQYRALWGAESSEGSMRFQKSPSTQRSIVLIATVNPSEIFPFFLPDTRNERLIRFYLGKPWNLGPSISTENSGECTIRFSRELDLRSLKHISTRSSPKYDICLPPAGQKYFDGELGLWFETEWGTGKKLIVKAVKKGSFAYNETDIHVGDELVSIDGVAVSRMAFAEAMELLKLRMSDIASPKQLPMIKPFSVPGTRGLLRGFSGGRDDMLENVPAETRPFTLVFRTIEERMRAVRMKAARSQRREINFGNSLGVNTWNKNTADTVHADVELKSLEHCDVGKIICVRESAGCPFQVKNRSANTTIYYRQKNCEQYEWQALYPGQSKAYTWEEPLKQKRLLVKAAVTNIPFESDEEKSGSSRRRLAINPSAASRMFRKVQDEEAGIFSHPVSFRLDEIGFEELIPLGNTRKNLSRTFLKGTVDVDRKTRILVLRDYSFDENQDDQIEHHVELLKTKVALERERLDALLRLEKLADECNHEAEDLATEAERIMADHYEESPSMRRNHVAIDVLQARGLNPETIVSSCNPYAHVILKTRRRQNPFFSVQNVNRTYYIRDTVNPSWRAQSFVFEVPPAAVAITRGHCVKIAIKNFRPFGRHQILGHTKIDLHTLRNQEPLEGWFPLAGRTGRKELEADVSNWGRGSVRLRVQWIYSTKSLIKRFVRLSQSRVIELEESATGMANQLARIMRYERTKQAEGKILQAVRLPALLSAPRSNRNPRKSSVHLSNRKVPKRKISKREDQKSLIQAPNDSPQPILIPHELQKPKRPHDSFSPQDGQRKRLHSSGEIVLKFLENQRVKLPSSRRLQVVSSGEEVVADLVKFDPALFRSWINVQALSCAYGAKLSTSQGKLQIQFRDDYSVGDGCSDHDGNAGYDVLLPRWPLFRNGMRLYSAQFVDSRRSFELAVSTILSSALHFGGQLTIRPITALNVSDGFSSMAVKVIWEDEIFFSESVDASMDPKWSEPPLVTHPEEEHNESSDIRIHIPPQKTSGFIRISIIGEKRHQKLKTKAEVGYVVLPIGSTIAVCSRYTESNRYTRWFSLNNTKDENSIEYNDRSLNHIESEKVSANLFQNYFAPCIQLSLGWKANDDNVTQRRESKVGSGESQSSSESPLVKSYCSSKLRAFSAALIDSDRASEVLSVQLLGLDVTYWETNLKTRISLSLEWLQVDYQDEDAKEAVVFAPTPTETLVPVVEFVLGKDNQKSVAEVVALDFIDFSMREFDLNVEESLVFDLYGLFTSVNEGRSTKERTKQDGSDRFPLANDEWRNETSGPSQLLLMLDKNESSDNTNMKLYIREMFLSGLKINLSYLKGRRQHKSTTNFVWPKEDADLLEPYLTSLRRSEVFASWSQNTAEDERRKNSNGKHYQNIPGLMASLLPTLTYAPIRLPGKALNHIFESPTAILQSIRKFYTGEILKQIYKIIGSLDVFGNPTMLLSSFMSGVRDMVVAPSVALMRSPTDPSRAGLIFAQGTLSLLSHSASGFFGTLARVSATAGQAIATLSLDLAYRDWHRNEVVVKTTNLSREWKKRGLRNAGGLVLRPLADLVLGVTWGAAGLVIQPLKGFRESGGRGLLKGTVIGLVGVIAKPTVGILDSFTHFTSAIHDIARSVNVLDKRIQPPSRFRLPYSFGPVGMLASYDLTIARAKKLLRGFPMKKSKNQGLPTEIVIHAEILPGAISYETVAIATSQRIVVIQVKHGAAGETTAELCWEGILSFDSMVTSRVDDQTYGHGSSLCLTSQRGDTHSRTESSEDILNEVPMSSSRLAFSMTPKEKRPKQLDKEADGYGVDGTCVKRFTIIAEYQFRQQLIRFHNAVCCIGAKLDDLITESIEHSGDEFIEGQTSFGLFLFDRKIAEQVFLNESRSMLDNVPWVSEPTILELAGYSRNEQKLLLSGLRERWSYHDELEAARKEGGPSWLVEVTARSRFVQLQQSENSVQPRTLSWDENDPNGLATDSIIEEGDDETDSFVRLPAQSPHGYETERSSYKSARVFEDKEEDLSEASRIDDNVETPHEIGSTDSTDHRVSFLSCQSPLSNAKRSESFATALSRTSSQNAVREQLRQDMRSNQTLESSRKKDRLDRMEALLESMLLFTADQAARARIDQHSTSNNALLDQLRQDVSRLRAQVVPDATTYEINLLRREISSLRAQIESRDGTSESSAALVENLSAEQID